MSQESVDRPESGKSKASKMTIGSVEVKVTVMVESPDSDGTVMNASPDPGGSDGPPETKEVLGLT